MHNVLVQLFLKNRQQPRLEVLMKVTKILEFNAKDLLKED
jgi:hypothetical protein